MPFHYCDFEILVGLKPFSPKPHLFLRPCAWGKTLVTMVWGKHLGLAYHEWFKKWALGFSDFAIAIDLASNLEPVLIQVCRISYNKNANFFVLFFNSWLLLYPKSRTILGPLLLWLSVIDTLQIFSWQKCDILVVKSRCIMGIRLCFQGASHTWNWNTLCVV